MMRIFHVGELPEDQKPVSCFSAHRKMLSTYSSNSRTHEHTSFNCYHIQKQTSSDEEDEEEESGDFNAGAIIGMIIVAALILVTLAYGWYTWPPKETKVATDTEKPSLINQESTVKRDSGSTLAKTTSDAANPSTTKQNEEPLSDADSSRESQGRTQDKPTENV